MQMRRAHGFADKLGQEILQGLKKEEDISNFFQTDIVTLQTAIVDSESFISFARMIIIIPMTGRN